MCTKPIAILAGCLGALLLLLGSSLSLAGLLGWTTPRSVPQPSELASFDYGILRPVTVEEKKQWKELGFVVLRGVIDPAAIDIVERESHRLCSWQMWFGSVCQIEEGRWQSDVLRDFLFHSPLGSIVHSFIGGSLRLYQDGLIGLARTWTSPLYYTFLKHVDHSGRPGKYGGLHSDTLGASVWVPLQDIDNETDGGSITLYEGFPHKGCQYRVGEKSTVWHSHDVLDMSKIAKNCAKFSKQRGEFTPRVKKGDVVLWWPSMMHNTQPFKVSRTRYALYARVVYNNSVTCVPKDCGWKGRPCCNAELIPKSGSVIDTPCYPQIFPTVLERELAAHFGSEPQPLVEPGGYSTVYGLDQKRLEMGSTCRRNLRMPSILEMSLEKNVSSKADAGNQSEIDESNVEEFFCQARLGEPGADLQRGRCFAVSRGGPPGSAAQKGLPARRSKALQDIDWNYTVPWGRDLWGVDDGDGWVEVSSSGAGVLYFPVSTLGSLHLVPKELCGPSSPDLCDERQKQVLLNAYTARFKDLRQEVEDVHRALEALGAEMQQAQDALQTRLSALTAERRSGALTRSSGALNARAHGALDPSVPTNGMVSWFKMEEVGREWPSSVGSYSGQEIQGPLEVVKHWRRGAPRPVAYLKGTSATKFIFGHVIHDTFSICSASRYESGQHGRVLQGSRTNWLHGHHAGRAGVAFYEGWMTPQRGHGVPPGAASDSLGWTVMCGTNAARRVYVNSTSVAVDGPAPDSGHQSLGVNVGAMMRGELTAAGDVPSDWAVAEVITWNRELSDREMLDVSAYLQRKLEGRGDEGKAEGPKRLPEVGGQLGNELSEIKRQDTRLKNRGRREKANIKGQDFFIRKQVLFERARDREGCSTSSLQDCEAEDSQELDGYMTLEPDVMEAAYLKEKHHLDVTMAAEFQRVRKDLAARAKAARKNLSEAGRRISELPFPSDGLKAWFRSEDAAAVWPSAVGSHEGRAIMGEVAARRMKGSQRRHLRALSGSHMASFRFGRVLAERFTLCSATRYSGSHRQRILVGEQHDLAHGHRQNYAGVAFYKGWATEPRPAEHEGYDKWMVMCGTNAAPRQYVNGVNHAVSATFSGGNQSLAINSGIMHGDERSDWEAMEIIAWDRALGDEGMLRASKYLLGKLQSGASLNETVLRRQLAEFWEVGESVAQSLDAIAASELEAESKIDDKKKHVLRMTKAWLHLRRAEGSCNPGDLSLCNPDEGTNMQDALSAQMEDLERNIAAKFGSVRELRAHVEWQRQNALVNADSMARTKALLDEPFEKYSVGRHCPHKGFKKKFYLYTGIPKIPCQNLCLETPACVFATWFSSGFCQLSKTCSPDARASDPSAVTVKIPSRLSQNKSKQKVQAQMSNHKKLEENLGKHRGVQMRLESDVAQAVHRLETQQDSLELLNLARWRRLSTEPKQPSAKAPPQPKRPPAKPSPQPSAKAPPQPKKPPAKASPQQEQPRAKANQPPLAKTSPRPSNEVSAGGRPKEL